MLCGLIFALRVHRRAPEVLHHGIRINLIDRIGALSLELVLELQLRFELALVFGFSLELIFKLRLKLVLEFRLVFRLVFAKALEFQFHLA
jgi:hypothetical protein